MIPAPDGFQYGIRFMDGSVMARWNGRTQRERAQEELDGLNKQPAWGRFPKDDLRLVRRSPGGRWEPVKSCTDKPPYQ